MAFNSKQAYLQHLESQDRLPGGFLGKVVRTEFTPREKPHKANGEPNILSVRMALLRLLEPSKSFAGVFTQNAFPGAPVKIGRKRLNEPEIQGIIVNNKVSNVAAPDDIQNSERLCAAMAQEIGARPQAIIPSSTGVIGWRLPAEEMAMALQAQKDAPWSDRGLPLTQAIMTTDRYPKLIGIPVGDGKIFAMAKGAGMIEPNMATMLAFILTDVGVSREYLRELLSLCTDQTFNQISIDGSESTSDTVLAVSSNHVKAHPDDFAEGFFNACRYLAKEIVRNGEGVEHLLAVQVNGAPNEEIARNIGKAIVNNNLFKCAIAGNDPNIGRLAGAIGSCLAKLKNNRIDPNRISMTIGDRCVFQNGVFHMDEETENALSDYFRAAALDPKKPYPASDNQIDIRVELECPAGASATTFGSDLTHAYVEENADYRS